MLQGKHIVVGISGGIAAYKTPLLIRMLRAAGAEVKVTTTPNALHFVTDLTLQTLSGNKVYSDVFAPTNDHSTEHISLPDWADLMIIAPATANVIGKMANGIADDALTTTFLAMTCPVLVAPAMNEKMYAHPALQHNLQTLDSFPHVTVLPCDEGFLACGTTGKGRMQEPEQIFLSAQHLMTEQTLAGRRVLITAGPTQEKIDPVRFISNYSSGKMGIALAEEAALRGAEVTLILGPTTLRPRALPRLRVINIVSAMQMYDAAVQLFPDADIAILCAAVADYRPEKTADHKIKRSANSNPEGKEAAEYQLKLVENPDIAATLGAKKRPNQTLVGFALETDHEEENALAKLRAKHLDMIVLNSLRNEGAAFGVDTNVVTIYHADGRKTELPKMSKSDVAKHILNNL